VKRLLDGRFGVVVGLPVTLVIATLLFQGGSYLVVGSPSDLRSATVGVGRLKAQAKELQDSTRIQSVFAKGWFAQPATRASVTDCAQALARGVHSQSVPLSDPLSSLTTCQAALEQLQSEQATIAAPVFADPSLMSSQKAMVALYDPPIAEARQTIALIVKWRKLTPRQRDDAVGSLQGAARESLAQSEAVAARQQQVSAALARSHARDAELSRQIDQGFTQSRTKVIRSIGMVVVAVVLTVVSAVFMFWRWVRKRGSGKEGGSESQD
jgi:hypothetical protein